MRPVEKYLHFFKIYLLLFTKLNFKHTIIVPSNHNEISDIKKPPYTENINISQYSDKFILKITLISFYITLHSNLHIKRNLKAKHYYCISPTATSCLHRLHWLQRNCCHTNFSKMQCK